jgi:hypothetical protein
MTGSYETIIEKLEAIEEDLRDLAYDRLRESADSPELLKEERRLTQARRAVEKAIRLLSATDRTADDVD